MQGEHSNKTKIHGFDEAHQIVFSKNFELLKVKYRRKMSPFLDLDLFYSFYFSEGRNLFFEEMIKELEEGELSLKKVYLFLGYMAIFEVNMNKPHSIFEMKEWDSVAQELITSRTKILDVKKEIFQNNIKYYRWSLEEDKFLTSIIMRQKSEDNVALSWKTIAQQFNQGGMVSLIRRPSQLKERWENTLKNSFERGNWTQEEDLLILHFVRANGTKWARLSRILCSRNEHTIKNRFFGLVSKHTSTPIKVVKKKKDYLNLVILDQVIQEIISEKTHTVIQKKPTCSSKIIEGVENIPQELFDFDSFFINDN